jgi:glutamate synthase (NADPH) large chain
MSGGVAYVLDVDGGFAARCNTQMVGLSKVEDPRELAELRALVEQHAALTESGHARRLLSDWSGTAAKLLRVMPHDYRRVLESQARMREKGLTPDQAELAAFEENAHDEARVGGN